MSKQFSPFLTIETLSSTGWKCWQGFLKMLKIPVCPHAEVHEFFHGIVHAVFNDPWKCSRQINKYVNYSRIFHGIFKIHEKRKLIMSKISFRRGISENMNHENSINVELSNDILKNKTIIQAKWFQVSV